MVWRACLLTVLALLTATAPARALDPATTGVVLMHGKWGNNSQMRGVAEDLREAGFLADLPEMPWSGTRLFDRSFDAAMEEIDSAAERLRAKGATRIVVAGQSLGGNAALAYAARGRPLAALVLFAPAHFPEGSFFREKAGDSIDKARAMVAAGEGDESGSFISLNDGNRNRPIRATARNYLSYYAPDAPAAMTLSAPKAGPAAILWIAGSLDKTTETFATRVRPLIPPATPVERLDVTASHMDTPDAGKAKAVEWLKALP